MTKAHDLPLCVALPTRDRRDHVLGALSSINDQLTENDELLVVDNGSTDGTAEAVSDWIDANLDSGRVIFEQRGGVSAARNAALREATAPILCFFDDDERVEDGWLSALREAWTTAGESVGAIGGPQRMIWQAERPDWLSDWLMYVVNGIDLGDEAWVLDQTPGRGYLSGGNMSLRRDAALAVGGFDLDRGVRPEEPHDRGEDEEMQRRLAANGYKILYEPRAVVSHFVSPDRLTADYFREAFRDRGALLARRGESRRWATYKLARGSARYAFLRVRNDPEDTNATFEVISAWASLREPRRANGFVQHAQTNSEVPETSSTT